MARKEGLRPIGESLRPIIDRIKKEREEKRKKNKPIRTQPKLPGMKKGGSMENPKKVDRIVDRIKNKKKSPADAARKIAKAVGKAAGVGALGAVPGAGHVHRAGPNLSVRRKRGGKAKPRKFAEGATATAVPKVQPTSCTSLQELIIQLVTYLKKELRLWKVDLLPLQ